MSTPETPGDFSELELGETIKGFAAGLKLFGRFTLRRTLGRGGMGVVWLAQDEQMHEEVALKFLPELIAADPFSVDELRREARKSRQLAHPHIVRVFDFHQEGNLAALSMEFVDGDTLSNLRLDREHLRFEVEELRDWVEQLCAALAYAHGDPGIVHRDLKPANLMVNRRGQVKVADFGVSSSLAESVSRISRRTTGGTLVYMSRQQLLGEDPTVADDLYSLGATLYDLLTGKPPFYQGNIDLQIREKVPPTLAERRAKLGPSGAPIPQAWEQTIAALLAKNPEERPQSAREVWERLNAQNTTPATSGVTDSGASFAARRPPEMSNEFAARAAGAVTKEDAPPSESTPVRTKSSEAPPPISPSHGSWTRQAVGTLLTGVVLAGLSTAEPLASWENTLSDMLAANSYRPNVAPAPTTLVRIDDSALASHPWPWTPLDFALFFQAALPLKPEVMAVDQVLEWAARPLPPDSSAHAIVLPEDQRPKLSNYERILRDQILRSPKMLLGSQLGIPDDPQVIAPLQEVPLLRNVRGPIGAIPEFTAVELQPDEAYKVASTIGFTNLPPLPQRRFNRVPLLLRYRGQVTPTYPLQAALLWAKLAPDDVIVEMGSYIDLGKTIRIPIDAAGYMRVDFGVPFGSFSYSELMLASEQKEASREPIVPIEQLTGRVVLLSRTDHAARTIPLPTGRNGSPGELFAAAIATIQNKSFIAPAPRWITPAVIAFLVLTSLWVGRMKKIGAVSFTVVAFATYVLVALTIFSRWLILLPVAFPVGMIVAGMILRLAAPDSRMRSAPATPR